MRYAHDIYFGDKILATPLEVGSCPVCSELVIPKCGKITVWHWAHKNKSDCDSWSEGETLWHLGWKEIVKPESQEVKIGCHRADVVGNGGTVVELQHSPIAPDEIQEREAFYGKMIWLFDASGFRKNLVLQGKLGADGNGYVTFRWKHPRLTHHSVKAPLFWDFGKGTRPIFQVRKMLGGRGCSCRGWGLSFTREEFIQKYLSSVLIGVGQ